MFNFFPNRVQIWSFLCIMICKCMCQTLGRLGKTLSLLKNQVTYM